MSAQNFLDVLEGKDPAVLGSSGKTIKSGPDDRVFVFFADHGAPGEVVCRALRRQVLAGLASCMLLAASGAVLPLMLQTMGDFGDLSQRKNAAGLASRTLLAAGGAVPLSRMLTIEG